MADYMELGRQINEKIGEKWKEQGHDLTGAFVKSLSEPGSVKVSTEEGLTVIEGYGRTYWKYINFGVLPADIKKPYAWPRIQGLTRYAELRMGLQGKEARSAAYAIATKHKRFGMPQPFASRTRFVEAALRDIEQVIDRAVDVMIGNEIEKQIQL